MCGTAVTAPLSPAVQLLSLGVANGGPQPNADRHGVVINPNLACRFPLSKNARALFFLSRTGASLPAALKGDVGEAHRTGFTTRFRHPDDYRPRNGTYGGRRQSRWLRTADSFAGFAQHSRRSDKRSIRELSACRQCGVSNPPVCSFRVLHRFPSPWSVEEEPACFVVRPFCNAGVNM